MPDIIVIPMPDRITKEQTIEALRTVAREHGDRSNGPNCRYTDDNGDPCAIGQMLDVLGLPRPDVESFDNEAAFYALDVANRFALDAVPLIEAVQVKADRPDRPAWGVAIKEVLAAPAIPEW